MQYSFQKKISLLRVIPYLYIVFDPILDPSHDLGTHLHTMRRLLQEREEVILQKYLEFDIIDHFDRRCSRLISDECDLSEE